MHWEANQAMWVSSEDTFFFASSLPRIISTVNTLQDQKQTNIAFGVFDITIFGSNKKTNFNIYLTNSNLLFYGAVGENLKDWLIFDECYSRALRLLPSSFISKYRYENGVLDIFLRTKTKSTPAIKNDWIQEGF